MTTLIFIILIVSRSHAFFLVVPIRSSLHVLVVVAVISYFQQADLRFLHQSGTATKHCGLPAVAQHALVDVTSLFWRADPCMCNEERRWH